MPTRSKMVPYIRIENLTLSHNTRLYRPYKGVPFTPYAAGAAELIMSLIKALW